MKDYLTVLTTELKSAQLIIKILQDKFKTKGDESMNTDNLSTYENFKSQEKHNSESETECTEIWRKKSHNQTIDENFQDVLNSKIHTFPNLIIDLCP
jgi:hypothetical protein